ncbi:hypothetical protein B0H21DRAFT_836229, partial [Amylocystis lapponica]
SELEYDSSLSRQVACKHSARTSTVLQAPSRSSFATVGSTEMSTESDGAGPQQRPQAPEPSPVPEGLTNIERVFASGLFADITLPHLTSRRAAQWHTGISQEDRVLVVVRAIRRAGFTTLGEFLAALFANGYTSHQSLVQTVTAFLQGKSKAGTRPVDIIELFWTHKRSQTYLNYFAEPPTFPSLPRHARAPSLRLAPNPDVDKPPSCRNALLDWALGKVLKQVDREADKLREPSLGLISLDEIALAEKQEQIAAAAPALFAVMTTAAVNNTARTRLERSASTRQRPQDSDSEEATDASDIAEESSDDNNNIVFKMRRDPWLAVTCTILVLLSFRYRFATIFPTLIGIFLFMNHSHQSLYRILSRLGISIAYSTVLRKLSLLAADSGRRLRLWGSTLADDPPTFAVLFDNINHMRRVWRKTLGDTDHVQSGTAATLIRLEDVPPGAMRAEQLLENVSKQVRAGLTVDELLEDIDWCHIHGIGVATVLRTWIKYIPALAKHHAATQKLFTTMHAKHPLRLRKTELETLRCSNIDESSTAGTGEVLTDIVVDQLHVIPQWLERSLVFLCGDQLSVDRLRKLKRYTLKTHTPFTRHDWVVPIIQLWHMKWAWQKAIFRLQWSTESGKGVFGLRHDIQLLQREKFNHVKCDFYPAHHILEDRLDALILQSGRLLCEEQSKVSYPAHMKLTDALQKYFEKDGPLGNCSFETLNDLASKCYERYMSTTSHDDALGNTPRDASFYGSEPTVAPEVDPQSADTGGLGDAVLANTVVFMRTTFWYREFCESVAEGDIGRTLEVIKLLRFSFWGAGSTNYGNELLEMACNLLKEFPPDLRTALLNNYLVNPSGVPGHWHELDLLQEHFNFWIKRLFNSKSLDFDSKFLKEAVSLNLRGFNTLRDRLTELFGIGKRSGRHTNASIIADLNALGFHYHSHHILRYRRGRQQPADIHDDRGPDSSSVENDALAEKAVANPIVMRDGIAMLAEFVTATDDM